MATFIPSITTSNPITVTTGLSTLTYEELLNSIASGGFQIRIDAVYLKANNIAQLSNSWYFTQRTQSGALKVDPDSYNVSPDQFQPSAFWDFNGKEYIVDNLTNINVEMLPNSTLDIVIFATQRTNYDAFEGNSEGARKQITTLGSFGNSNDNFIVLTENGKTDVLDKIVLDKDTKEIDNSKLLTATLLIGLGIFGLSKA